MRWASGHEMEMHLQKPGCWGKFWARGTHLSVYLSPDVTGAGEGPRASHTWTPSKGHQAGPPWSWKSPGTWADRLVRMIRSVPMSWHVPVLELWPSVHDLCVSHCLRQPLCVRLSLSVLESA